MKRLFDLVGGGVILLFATPLMILVAILIKIESKGSVFFKQERVGLHGRPFKIYKFRSMVSNAEKLGPYYTKGEDSRITRIGHYIRKSSIDELPQLLNVLLGSMSLVGPRPDVPAQRSNYTQQQWDRRNSVRPGITGLAQAKLRSIATAEERMTLDLEYVDKASVLFDIRIILLTIRQLFVTKGSN